MTTSIGSVTLDRDMVWDDEFDYPTVNASAEETVGGGLIYQEFERTEVGRFITLVSDDSLGLQTRSTVAALRALAESPGSTYTLTINSNGQTVTKTVRFRHEDGDPVVFKPFMPRQGLHSDTIYYHGTIKMMVV